MTQAAFAPSTIAEVMSVLAAHPQPAPSENAATHRAAVAMILRDAHGTGLETLLIERAEHPSDPWSGQMAFPGGHIADNDKNLEAAARRETHEEVSLELSPEMNIGRLGEVRSVQAITFDLVITPFVYHHPQPGKLTLNEEVADAVWVPLAFLGDPANIGEHTFPPMPRHTFPAFHYGHRVIWGLTYGMIADFMRLFGIELSVAPSTR